MQQQVLSERLASGHAPPPATIIDKIWRAHVVANDTADLIAIDRIFLHERTGSIALESLASRGRVIRDPHRVFCTIDHIVDTLPGRNDTTLVPQGRDFILATRAAARAARIRLFDVRDPDQGIVHVISPELGLALPGLTIVCPDSHTCTQGGVGALAWGIGSTEAEHALATSSLRVNKPASLRIRIDGCLAPGVSAKDICLSLISRYGVMSGAGRAIEFCGAAVRALGIEARLTLCNMATELAAMTAIIAPDDTTFEYLAGRRYAPRGAAWERALAHWLTLSSDADARFDAEWCISVSDLAPMITWGTNPAQAVPVTDCIPPPASDADRRALAYMDLMPGTSMSTIKIDAAFIGSCTNGRIADLRAAARILRGRRIAPGVRAICVPGSMAVKRQAEAEGLHESFVQAGFEWRESGCSLCFYAGGEDLGLGKRVVSSTNRNFEGRQGPGTRTHIASPATVAASAVRGARADARQLEISV